MTFLVLVNENDNSHFSAAPRSLGTQNPTGQLFMRFSAHIGWLETDKVCVSIWVGLHRARPLLFECAAQSHLREFGWSRCVTPEIGRPVRARANSSPPPMDVTACTLLNGLLSVGLLITVRAKAHCGRMAGEQQVSH